ncbi:HAMP domain-containing sensor histidine kinase [Synechococcus sp. CS-197]|uniref:HAMP domain-containing sensor histidine kinase n=1 Tax=Synechococcus sp. CS-197 TaxID=2847985 RepID=UPI0001525B1D|nr:HAMP domain-containing sensor histidine kinase [Synechococcus sp. CS-197]MCT0251433.1 HAMP domain-containing histidine kinase [Synechococcus sp. CS-197]CAK24212.1 Two-component system sensor histidine kinase [Synechococcus sp. WH 7803]
MQPSRPWKQRLTGSMLGQLQLATYAAVLLGFTAATSTGLWLSERTRLQVGEAELRAGSESLAFCLVAHGGEGKDVIRRELQDHSSVRTQLWLEQPDGSVLSPERSHLPLPQGLLQTAMAANSTRTPGQAHVIELNGRDYLTLLDRKLNSGALLWSSTEITGLGRSQTEFLGWMIVIWGSCLGGSLALVTLLVRRITKPLQDLSDRSAELTADGLKSAALPVPTGPVELTRLTRTYNALIDRLAWSWSQQRQFVSAVSHELQTPLTLVSGSLKRVMRKAPDLDPALRQRLQDAQDETTDMQQLLNDLLDLSRSDSGRLQVKKEAVQLQPVIDTIVRVQGPAYGRTIEAQGPGDQAGLVVLADASRLHQVLVNLVENAHKYSPPDQPIELTLARVAKGVQVEVIDHGIGIPSSDQPHIFERFHRGSNTGGYSGSGLGLSVVKLLVEAMGGSITVASEPGMGSRFCILLQSA